jgi:cell wall-associated NlpC family hydrolase
MDRLVRFFGRTSILSCFALLLWGATAQAAFGDVALKYGMQGEDVALLQHRLSALGYSIDIIDGNFGSNTLQAVIAFQADNGMETDGIVGLRTFRCIQEVKKAPVSRGSVSYSLRSKGTQIVALAQQFLHVPYAWGGSSPGGFDCSGFVYYLYAKQGFYLPRMADGQFMAGQWVDKRELQPGDLVFFETYESGPSHVGIYMGGGQFIHASSGAGEVTITPLSKSYYADRYLGARRIVY